MSTEAARVEPPLILASASPRRRDLFSRLVTGFTILSSPVEEEGDTRLPSWPIEEIEVPHPFVLPMEDDSRLWAWRKAVDVLASNAQAIMPDSLILAADTVVLAPSKVLGKPKSRAEAGDMLNSLRGRDHLVITGFVLLQSTSKGDPTLLCVENVRSIVEMRPLSDAELSDYLDTDEPYDKAGAYALQGLGGKLIEQVQGCKTNVIGLPLCRLRERLGRAGVTSLRLYPEDGYCDACPANCQP